MAAEVRPGDQYTVRVRDLIPIVLDTYCGRVFGLRFEALLDARDAVRGLVEEAIRRWGELRPREAWWREWPSLVRERLRGWAERVGLKEPPAPSRMAPIAFYGPPGIGKSMSVRCAAKILALALFTDVPLGTSVESAVESVVTGRYDRELAEVYTESREEASREPRKFHLLDIRASQLEPPDILGLPSEVTREGARVTTFAPPVWLPQTPFGVLFFDELALAREDIQHVLYQLVLDEVIAASGYELPGGWLIVSASNRPTDIPGLRPVSPPLANRFVNYVVPGIDEEDVEQWLKWARMARLHPAVIMYIEGKHRPCYHRVDGRVEVTCDWGAKTLLKFPGGAEYMADVEGRTWSFPSPRSWEMVSKILYVYAPPADEWGRVMERAERALSEIVEALKTASGDYRAVKAAVKKALDEVRKVLGVRADLMPVIKLSVAAAVGADAAREFIEGFLEGLQMAFYSLSDVLRASPEEMVKMLRDAMGLWKEDLKATWEELLEAMFKEPVVREGPPAEVIGLASGLRGDELAVRLAQLHAYAYYLAREVIGADYATALPHRFVADLLPQLAREAWKGPEQLRAAHEWLTRYLESLPAGLPGRPELPEAERWRSAIIKAFKELKLR